MSYDVPTVMVVNPLQPDEFIIINADRLRPDHVLWGADRHPLDHDGDGRKGGSSKPTDDAATLTELRAEYTAKAGKRPFMG